MIIIKDQDFEMKQVKSTPFFDFKIAAVINKGKSNERTEMKVLGNSMTFYDCINHIIALKMAQKDVTYTVEEYKNAYREELYKIAKPQYIEKEVIEKEDEVIKEE